MVPGSPRATKRTLMIDMKHARFVRPLIAAVTLACSRPNDAPAQLDRPGAAFATSKDPAVSAAAVALEAGRPWRATEIIDSAYRGSPTRSSDAVLIAATAAAAWGGWTRVERELATMPWLDSAYAGRGRELLARAALARGADSVARFNAERAVSQSRTETHRGIREVLLARSLDRLAIGDSAAATYLRAARRLPSIADWLELRAAGATSDASRRQRSYGRVKTEVARSRIAPTEAQARERWRDFAGAATAYAELGDTAQSLRVKLLASPDSSARATVRAHTLALLATNPSASDARVAIALLDSSFAPLSGGEELIVARAASSAGMLPRAASGFARAEKDLDPPSRYAYGTVLARLGRDLDAAAQFGFVPAVAPLGPVAAYQRGRVLVRAGRTAAGRDALRRVAQTSPKDTSAAAPALFLLADFATDDGRDTDARAGFAEVARRFPTSDLAPVAVFRAATIAYAAGSFDAAARDFDTLIERYPRSADVSAARYWSGRARERAGDKRRASERWREIVSGDPHSYYAMKASLRLGTRWTPAPRLDSVKPSPGLERVGARGELLDVVVYETAQGARNGALWHTRLG
jgi:TolA-binding protein